MLLLIHTQSFAQERRILPDDHTVPPMVGRVLGASPMHARDGFLRIPVRAGKGKSAWFVLDTGSYRSYVTEEGYKRLRADGARLQKDGSLEPLEVMIAGVSLGDHSFVKDSEEYPSLQGEGYAGTIGIDLLSRFRIGVDVKKREFRIWPTSVTKGVVMRDWFGSAAGKSPNTLVVERGLWDRGQGTYSTLVNVGNLTLPMCVDTGSEETYLASELAPALRPNVRAGSSKATFYFGVADVAYYQISRYGLGELSIPASRPIGATRSPNEPGLLGTDAMSSLRLLFDFASRRLYVVPRVGTPKAPPIPKKTGPFVYLPTQVWIYYPRGEVVRVEPGCTYEAPADYRKVSRPDGCFDLVPPGLSVPTFRKKPRLLVAPTIEGRVCADDLPVRVPKGSKFTVPPNWKKVRLNDGSHALYPPGYEQNKRS